MKRKRNTLALVLVFCILFSSIVNVSAATKTPSAPTLSYTPTTPTNGSVTVTVYYPNTAVNKQYKLGSAGIWTTYSAPITITSNVYVYARYQDKFGSWSNTGGYNITNIDKTPPADATITASPTTLTNQDVVITVGYSPDSTTKQYKIGSVSVWSTYTAPLVLSNNDIVYARSSDSAGNWNATTSYSVSNIDKTPPAAPVLAADTTNPTNGIVYVSIVSSDDSNIVQYKEGADGIWTDYTAPIPVDSNTTIYAKARDNAGNWSTEASYTVDYFDKEPPAAPTIIASTANLTNSAVTLTINYSPDSATQQYRIGDSASWTDYTVPLVISANTTVYAKGADSAGNWSSETSYTVDNIDTTPPEKPTFALSNTNYTDEPITITISYSNDSTQMQYKIGDTATWTNYTEPITLKTNNTIYAKSSDIAGNWNNESSCSISNFRRTVLGYTVKYSSTDMSSYNSMTANVSAINEIETATFTVDGLGNLSGTAPVDQINYANSNGIRTKLMVGNNFDSAIAKQLLENATNRQALKNNILSTLQTYNYKGVDIDIENVPASDRNYFTALMSELYSTLKPLGYEVTVAVPAKTYDASSATWNYAFDYKSLSNYSDFLMIMAYDEHYPGGTPGAVASIDWVTSVVDYALTVVPKEKIILGMAAYGYDWGGTTTKSYSINGCYNLANQYGAAINFDNATKSKYFTYTVSGVSHTVWFEDADTIAYKLDLTNSRDLKGVGIWRLGLENANYWTMIRSKFNK